MKKKTDKTQWTKMTQGKHDTQGWRKCGVTRERGKRADQPSWEWHANTKQQRYDAQAISERTGTAGVVTKTTITFMLPTVYEQR